MENNGKNKQEVEGIADANDIIEQKAVRDAKVGVEIG